MPLEYEMCALVKQDSLLRLTFCDFPLTFANTLTVLQTYRQAFSILQLTHLNHIYFILIPGTIPTAPKTQSSYSDL
jgi:hypothetical protein